MVQSSPGEAITVQFGLSQTAEAETDDSPHDNQEAVEENDIQAAATDEEVVELAAEEYPETQFAAGNRVEASWRMLWRAGILSDAQVEGRWGLDKLRDFMRELAQEKAISDSQRFAEEEIRATQMETGEHEESNRGSQGSLRASQGHDSLGEDHQLERQGHRGAHDHDGAGVALHGGGHDPGQGPQFAEGTGPEAARGDGDGHVGPRGQDSPGSQSQKASRGPVLVSFRWQCFCSTPLGPAVKRSLLSFG